MVRSMTGFGRGQVLHENLEVTVEIKSVNHRYFEFSARVPRSYNFLDEKLKSFCASKISRGKIEIYVSIENIAGSDTVVEINEDVAAAYVEAYKTLSKKFKIKNINKGFKVNKVRDKELFSFGDDDLCYI